MAVMATVAKGYDLDYAWRAVHETAQTSKRVVRAYYWRPQEYAASTGST